MIRILITIVFMTGFSLAISCSNDKKDSGGGGGNESDHSESDHDDYQQGQQGDANRQCNPTTTNGANSQNQYANQQNQYGSQNQYGNPNTVNNGTGYNGNQNTGFSLAGETIKQLIDKNCKSCHGAIGNNPKLTSDAAIQQNANAIVIAVNGGNAQIDKMPPAGTLDSATLNTFNAWQQAALQNNGQYPAPSTFNGSNTSNNTGGNNTGTGNTVPPTNTSAGVPNNGTYGPTSNYGNSNCYSQTQQNDYTNPNTYPNTTQTGYGSPAGSAPGTQTGVNTGNTGANTQTTNTSNQNTTF